MAPRKKKPTICETELRKQLYKEIQKKSLLCANPTYMCSLPRILGHNFCAEHILRDHSYAFKQCNYIYRNRKRCTNALKKPYRRSCVPASSFCFEHTVRSQLQHATKKSSNNIVTNERLLHSLSHHVDQGPDFEIKQQLSQAIKEETEEEIDVVGLNCPPRVHYIQHFNQLSHDERQQFKIIQFENAHEPGERNVEYPCDDENESDPDSADSADEDVHRHASIYSYEETYRICRSKETKLQELYMQQIERLYYMLQERRREYLDEIVHERELYCSIRDQKKFSPDECREYEEFKALNGFRTRRGIDAVLFRKYEEKRIDTADSRKRRRYQTCHYKKCRVKCKNPTLPCCKFCIEHVLKDKKQVLFQPCGKRNNGVACEEATPCITVDSVCVLHLGILPTEHPYKYQENHIPKETLLVPKQEIIDAAYERYCS